MANNIYTSQGRTLMIKFTCGRCGAETIIPYADQAEETEGNLHEFRPPEGWSASFSFHIPLLCPECTRQFNNWMNGGNVT